jgi:hypothetical protein
VSTLFDLQCRCPWLVHSPSLSALTVLRAPDSFLQGGRACSLSLRQILYIFSTHSFNHSLLTPAGRTRNASSLYFSHSFKHKQIIIFCPLTRHIFLLEVDHASNNRRIFNNHPNTNTLPTMKTSVILSVFASVAVRVLAATPPGCLLSAVNEQPAPTDLPSICGKEATNVQSAIANICPTQFASAAQSAFIATCSSAGSSVGRQTIRRVRVIMRLTKKQRHLRPHQTHPPPPQKPHLAPLYSQPPSTTQIVAAPPQSSRQPQPPQLSLLAYLQPQPRIQRAALQPREMLLMPMPSRWEALLQQ